MLIIASSRLTSIGSPKFNSFSISSTQTCLIVSGNKNPCDFGIDKLTNVYYKHLQTRCISLLYWSICGRSVVLRFNTSFDREVSRQKCHQKCLFHDCHGTFTPFALQYNSRGSFKSGLLLRADSKREGGRDINTGNEFGCVICSN